MPPSPNRDRTAEPGALVRGMLACALVAGLACGDEAPVEPPISVATTVTVSPASATMQALEDTVRFSATVLDQDGRVMAGAVVEWSSSDEAVAVVDGTGLVTAVGNGEATVTAGSGGVVGEVVVTVEQVVAEIRVMPDSVEFWTVGDTVRLATEALDRNGHTVAGIEMLWSSSDEEVATVDQTGLVTAMRDGTTNVKAAHGPATGTVFVEVKAAYSEREVLRSFYFATGGPAWVNDDNWLTNAPLGDWHGLETDYQGRVVSILLSHNGLRGSVPWELARLEALQTLDLGNNILGSGRCSIHDMSTARQHAPEYEAYPMPLSAATPWARDELAAQPQSNHNRFSGSIPPELGQLANLEHLDLGSTGLSGSIPRSFGKLTKLKELHLHSNDLSGAIPEEFWNLDSLVLLRLSYNRLTGSISGIEHLTRLNWLALQCNKLNGPLPSAIGRLVNLQLAQLQDARFSGEIPSSLRELQALTLLDLRGNEFSGGIPPSLGDLPLLHSLGLSENVALIGSFPLSLTRLTSLRFFYWWDTQLCVPRNQRFWSWVDSMSNFLPRRSSGRSCGGLPTEILASLYNGTGGSRWTRNGNWLTDSPLSSWHGITVEDSLVTGLDLSGNGLAGPLPSVIGEFLDLRDLNLSDNVLSGALPAGIGDLERLETLDLEGNQFSGTIPDRLSRLGSLVHLDLGGNRFSGRIPHRLGRLSALERLDLSDNDMEGALPGTLTDLGALEELRWKGSGACAPEAAWFQTWLSSLSTRDGPDCDAPFLLSIPGAHLTQAAQDTAGTVPVIAGRPALLRVFATVDRANDHRAGARAVLRSGNQPAVSLDMTLQSSRGIPDDLVLESLAGSYNAVVPGSVLQPGMEMVVEVDPGGTVPWADGSQVRLPEVGHLSVDVREVPTMELTIVPVIVESSADSSVLDWVKSPNDAPIGFLKSVLPIAEFDLTVREPLHIGHAPRAFNDWVSLIQDIDLLRASEGASGYWYGAVRLDRRSGINGLAYLTGRASIGIADSEVFAHEIGHNMSLRHAPCGDPDNLDVDFPYLDGSIGVPGYDPRSGELVDPAAPDLMSYCRGGWISDYNFNKAMQYRLTEEVAGPARASAAPAPPPPPAPHLLVRGGISPDGDLHLDPAFVLDAPAQTPTAPGPYRIAALATNGSTIFEHSFDMDEISVGGGGFLFLLPFSEAAARDLARIILTGPDGAVQLDRDTRVDPVAIVMDRATGRIRSILRGEAAVEAARAAQAQATGAASGTGAATAAATAETDATLTLVSHGLPGTAPR